MTDQNDFNRQVIEEFRANRSKGQVEDRPRLLLTTRGARSGQPRTTPMMYIPDGDRLLVIASNICYMGSNDSPCAQSQIEQ